jgi:hypothetical protein
MKRETPSLADREAAVDLAWERAEKRWIAEGRPCEIGEREHYLLVALWRWQRAKRAVGTESKEDYAP